MDHRPLWARGQSWTLEDTKALGWLAIAAVAALAYGCMLLGWGRF